MTTTAPEWSAPTDPQEQAAFDYIIDGGDGHVSAAEAIRRAFKLGRAQAPGLPLMLHRTIESALDRALTHLRAEDHKARAEHDRARRALQVDDLPEHEKRIALATREELEGVVLAIAGHLYFDGPDTAHDADVIGHVANAMVEAGFSPTEGE